MINLLQFVKFAIGWVPIKKEKQKDQNLSQVYVRKNQSPNIAMKKEFHKSQGNRRGIVLTGKFHVASFKFLAVLNKQIVLHILLF